MEATYGGKVTLFLGEGGLKTAAEGGVRRSLSCICATPSTLACPCCDIINQLKAIKDKDGPLFPTGAGGVCTKAGVTAAYRSIAKQLGVAESVAQAISGHAGRVAGALFLTLSLIHI
mgnify:CR=1 FL=1